MTKSDIGRTIAAFACTLVASATCIIAAVAPAQAGGATAGAAVSTSRSIV